MRKTTKTAKPKPKLKLKAPEKIRMLDKPALDGAAGGMACDTCDGGVSCRPNYL